MNSVSLIGRLTRDPDVRYTGAGQMAVVRFSIAIDRFARQGEEKKTDFPSIVAFGKTAETCGRFLAKGRLVGISGRLQTGSYQNKNGDTVYTTDVIADRVDFLEWGDRNESPVRKNESDLSTSFEDVDEMPDSFQAIDEDVPW